MTSLERYIDHVDDEGNNEFLRTAEKGQLIALNRLLQQGANVHHLNNHGDNAITFAARHGYKDMVLFLIDQHVDISCVNNEGNNALLLASWEGHVDVVKHFIKHKIDIKLRNKDGRNALHLSSMEGHTRVMEILIQHGIDIKATNKNGRTALHLAAMKGHKNAVKLLIEHNVPVRSLDIFGRNALHLASYGGHVKVVKYLLRKHIINKTCLDKNGNSALHLASIRGHRDVIELLQDDENINSKNNNGRHALHLASMEGHMGVVEFLFTSKIDVTDVDNTGRSALHLAASCGHIDIVQCLLNNGVDFASVDEYGCTALHLALYEEQKDIAEFLLNHIYFSGKNNFGKNTILAASVTGQTSVIELLYKFNADLSCKDRHGCNALHLASLKGHDKVVQQLLELNFDSTLTNNSGKNALHCACEKGHVHVVELLTDLGITFSFENISDQLNHEMESFSSGRYLQKVFRTTYIGFRCASTKKSALHYAAEKGFLKIVQVLVDTGASLHLKTRDGHTALDLAKQKEHRSVMEFLQDKRTLKKAKESKTTSPTATEIFAPFERSDIGTTTAQDEAGGHITCEQSEVSEPIEVKKDSATNFFRPSGTSIENVPASVEQDFSESNVRRDPNVTPKKIKDEEQGAVGGQPAVEGTSGRRTRTSSDFRNVSISESENSEQHFSPGSDQPIDFHAMYRELQAVFTKYMSAKRGPCALTGSGDGFVFMPVTLKNENFEINNSKYVAIKGDLVMQNSQCNTEADMDSSCSYESDDKQ